MPEGVSDAAVGGLASQSVAYAPAPMQRKYVTSPAAAGEALAQDRAARREVRQAEPKARPALRILAFSGITGTSDPASLRGELEARLKDPALVAALAGLPSGTDLALQVDASGQVVAATFSQAFPGDAQAKALILVWRLRSWTGRMAGQLDLTLGILALNPIVCPTRIPGLPGIRAGGNPCTGYLRTHAKAPGSGLDADPWGLQPGTRPTRRPSPGGGAGSRRGPDAHGAGPDRGPGHHGSPGAGGHGPGAAARVRPRGAARRGLRGLAPAHRLRADHLPALHRGLHDRALDPEPGGSRAGDRHRLRLPGCRAVRPGGGGLHRRDRGARWPGAPKRI